MIGRSGSDILLYVLFNPFLLVKLSQTKFDNNKNVIVAAYKIFRDYKKD